MVVIALAKEDTGFLENDFTNVAFGRGLVTPFVDLLLGLDRNRLVRRHGIHGEEAVGVAGETIEGDKPDPFIDVIECSLFFAVEQVIAKRSYFGQRFGMEEHFEIFPNGSRVAEIKLSQTRGDFIET